MLFSKRFVVVVCAALIFLIGSFFIFKTVIFAEGETDGVANMNKVFISEVQISGENADDEFIELYNSSDYSVNLKDWSIKKKTASGEDSILIDLGSKRDAVSGDKISEIPLEIAPLRYFLIAPRYHCGDSKDQKCYMGIPQPDNYYSNKGAYLTDGNTLFLYDNLNKEPVDTVSWDKIPKGQSLERKVFEDKIIDTIQLVPNPQNSSFVNEEDNSNNDTISDGSGASTDNEDSSVSNINNNSGNTDNGSGSGNLNQSEDTSADNGNENNNLSDQETTNSSQLDNPSGNGDQENTVLEKKVVVSELLMNPVGDDEAEFIEIYNAGKDAVDLSGWSLEDQAGKLSKYVFTQGASIDVGQYEVFYSEDTKISLNNSGDGVILRDNAGNIVYQTPMSGEAKEGLSFALSDGQNWVWTTVATPANRNIIKEPVTKTGTTAKKKKTATETKKDDKVKDDTNKKDNADIENQKDDKNETQKEDVPQEENYDFSDMIAISEIFPDPAGKDNQPGNYEWVEFFNESDRDVNLKGWFLDDVLGKGSSAFRFLEDKIVPAKGYIVVSSEESKIFFNNSQDEVNLLWPDQKVADSVSYKQSKEDFSYSLSSDGNWFWTKEKTLGAKNALMKEENKINKKASAVRAHQNSSSFTEEEDEGDVGDGSGEVLGLNAVDKSEYHYAKIADAKNFPLKTLVGLDGIVSVPPGVFGKNVFYLIDQNSGEGLQMFSYQDNVPALNVGDRVQVFGTLSEVGGEKRLILDSNFWIEKISSDNLLSISSLKCAEADESALGDFVKIEGTVSEVTDDNLIYIDDGSGKLKVYAKPDSGISFVNLKPGDRIAVTGHISRTSLGYRILPRFSSDVHFIEKQIDGIIKSENPSSIQKRDFSDWPEISSFLVLLLFLDWFRMRMRMRKK